MKKTILIVSLFLGVCTFTVSHFSDEYTTKSLQFAEGICVFIFLITGFWVVIDSAMKRDDLKFPVIMTCLGFLAFVTIPYEYKALWWEITHIGIYTGLIATMLLVVKPKKGKVLACA